MSKHVFPVVIGAVDNTLLLIFLQYSGNDGLSDYTDAPIIYHGRPERVKTFYVYRCVSLQQSREHEYFFFDGNHLKGLKMYFFVLCICY